VDGDLPLLEHRIALVHKLLAQQLKTSTSPSGEVDLDALLKLVAAAYEEHDGDRRRTDHSIATMINEVEANHRRLLDALEVIPEGLVLFDAEDRYVLWNRRYEELHTGGRERITVGQRFEDMLRAALADGRYPEARGREDAWLAERLAQHAEAKSSHEQHISGDRWVRIEERRTADGGSIGVRIDITDLKRREASFRMLFDANPVPMWVFDRETFKFLAVNDACVQHYGYSREEFLAKTVLDMRPEEDRDEVRRSILSLEPAIGPPRVRRHLKADGSEIHVCVYTCILTYQGQPAWLAGLVDITKSKQAEEEVRRAEEFLNTVIENVPVTITVKDANDLTYRLINRTGEEFFGIPREQIIGKTPFDIFPKRSAEIVVENDKAVLQRGVRQVRQEHSVNTPANGTRIVTTTQLPIMGIDHAPQYLVTVIQDVTEQRRAQDRAAHLAQHDVLTDLPNRAAFNERLAAVLAREPSERQPFAVVCIGLDRFKEVNDVFGHSIGDAALREVSLRLGSVTEGAFLARLGGDEFAILLTDGLQPLTAERMGECILRSVTDDIVVEGQRPQIGLSIGVAIYPSDGADAATLLANADAALHRAKVDGRGVMRFFEADMDWRLREQRSMRHDLQSAITGNQLLLHYQPQSLIDGTIIGLEALARWQHPARGLVGPKTFVPLAEESGAIIAIGEWVLRQACREAAAWPKPLRIAVNLSPVQFRHDDLPTLIHSVLLQSGLEPARLELEITEGALIHNLSRALSILRRLKSLGVRIAMDDFGTGYSSLSYLQAFPFDKIKIDQTFVSNLDSNPQSAAIVRAVIGLCRGLDLRVVAEGVENEAQLDFLSQEKCDELQGFIIGRPRPIEEYAQLVGRDPTSREKPGLACAG
jgi:diguanylate cyclase (GGDEF)-like protein/PAS domain S-box-containing protein